MSTWLCPDTDTLPRECCVNSHAYSMSILSVFCVLLLIEYSMSMLCVFDEYSDQYSVSILCTWTREVFYEYSVSIL